MGIELFSYNLGASTSNMQICNDLGRENSV